MCTISSSNKYLKMIVRLKALTSGERSEWKFPVREGTSENSTSNKL